MTGSSPSINVDEIQDGGVRFKPIMDNWLRTTHQKHQVNVQINNIASKCVGSCDFVFASDLVEPIVTNIDISALPEITITGSDFDLDPNNNIVKVGDYSCVVSEATSTEIKCLVDKIPAGDYNFTVNVVDKVSIDIIELSLRPSGLKKFLVFFVELNISCCRSALINWE